MSRRQWNLLCFIVFENVCEHFKCTPRFSTIKFWSSQLMHPVINLAGSLWRAICPWIQIKYAPWQLKNILLDEMTELSLTRLPEWIMTSVDHTGPWGSITEKKKTKIWSFYWLILGRTNASFFLLRILAEIQASWTLLYWNLAG